VNGQQHDPAALYPRERPDTHFIGGWVGPRAGMEGGKSRPYRDSIPDRPDRSSVAIPTELPATPHIYIWGGGGTRWHSWFKHCATSPKFVVSIPDGGLWNFSLTRSCRPHYGPGVDSATNGNEYQKYLLEGKGGRCVGLITLPPSCADRSEILGASTSKGCPGL